MNYFEQELRRLAKACDLIKDPVFAGRACFVDLGGDNRAKVQFVGSRLSLTFDALKATILSRMSGEVDTLLIRFEDVWGRKSIVETNGGIPHIWSCDGRHVWSDFTPTDMDMKKLAAEVGAYLSVFTDHTRIPEKTRAHTDEKESVAKKLREVKSAPAPRKTSAKKQGPER